VTVKVPAADGVNVTEQLAELRVQLAAGVKEPLAVPAEVKLTVPVGVPVDEATVAVQVELLVTKTDEGEQLTLVVVAGRGWTVREKD
jgi:hypothetical protein